MIHVMIVLIMASVYILAFAYVYECHKNKTVSELLADEDSVGVSISINIYLLGIVFYFVDKPIHCLVSLCIATMCLWLYNKRLVKHVLGIFIYTPPVMWKKLIDYISKK